MDEPTRPVPQPSPAPAPAPAPGPAPASSGEALPPKPGLGRARAAGAAVLALAVLSVLSLKDVRHSLLSAVQPPPKQAEGAQAFPLDLDAPLARLAQGLQLTREAADQAGAEQAPPVQTEVPLDVIPPPPDLGSHPRPTGGESIQAVGEDLEDTDGAPMIRDPAASRPDGGDLVPYGQGTPSRPRQGRQETAKPRFRSLPNIYGITEDDGSDSDGFRMMHLVKDRSPVSMARLDRAHDVASSSLGRGAQRAADAQAEAQTASSIGRLMRSLAKGSAGALGASRRAGFAAGPASAPPAEASPQAPRTRPWGLPACTRCADGETSRAGDPIPPVNPVRVGSAKFLGVCGEAFAYEVKNTSEVRLKTYFTNNRGEAWDVDLPPGGSTIIKAKEPLSGGLVGRLSK